MGPVDWLHERLVFGRRVKVLASWLARLVPRDASVLDVGCGSGDVASLLGASRPDVKVQGIDVLVRPGTRIPVTAFDGLHVPHADGTFDAVVFVDVLHHATDPVALLREAKRVTRDAIVLKDHFADSALAAWTLRWMDDVGNVKHGVTMQYDYWPERKWRATFAELGLEVMELETRLGLYAWPLRPFFERRMHFVALLRPRR